MIEHEQRVRPDIAFRVEFGRLGDSFHGSDLRQDVCEQTRFVQQFESPARAAFGKDATQLITNTLG